MDDIYIFLKEFYVRDAKFELKVEKRKAYFIGFDHYAKRELPSKIRVEEKKLIQIQNLFDVLRVRDWKNNYQAKDIGAYIIDGGLDWRLYIRMATYSKSAYGTESFPSFKDPSITSLDEELYCLLKEGLFSILYNSVAYEDIL